MVTEQQAFLYTLVFLTGALSAGFVMWSLAIVAEIVGKELSK